ncbi:HEAT repeat domain-containing protein [Embleya sp. NPDC005575]|uniref:HEAT repeat domain-containing protein n=1 Tax=Embleya sp. NPDC005575 TaxID=3156892 RepID=UPI0033A6812E
MTTSDHAAVTDAVTDAVRRGDVDRLSAYFDGTTPCPVAVLRQLIGHPDPAPRHLGVVLLRERAGRPDQGSTAESASLLSEVPAGPAETAAVLAEAYARLRVPVPEWRSAAWPAKVRIAWLRAEIIGRPEATVRAEPSGEELYRAVGSIDADAPADLDDYLRGLVARPDPVLRAGALRVLREGVYGALLGPEQARGRLVELLEPAGGARVVAGALAQLAEPWAAGDAPAGLESALRRLVTEYPEAVETAARFGLSGLLREIAADPRLPGSRRRRALELVGEFAERGDTAALSALARMDPLLFAVPFVACLRAMHRRGHFVRPDDVPAVIEMALADYRVSAADFAIVLFTVRHEVVRVLTAVSEDDPHWPRCLDLLHAAAAQGAADLPVVEVLTARLAASERPEPILSVLRELRHRDADGAEGAVLAALPRAPRAALGTLEVMGGPRTVAALRVGLGMDDPDGVVVPHLRAVADRALELVWHLTDDPDARRELRARLDRRELPKRIASDLGIPDPDELALLTADLDADRPVDALCRLARNGDARSIPVLADLLLRSVGDLVANRGEETTEPVVPDEVIEAVGDLGERLHRRGALRPVCLPTASDPKAAREALLTDITLDLLDRVGITAAETAVLLELLLRTRALGVKQRIHRLIRHRDPHVRKHAIALLARDPDPDAARSLSASLIPLTSAADPQTVRQALHALGRARAHWAGGAIAACLEHPVMNIRKTAARALLDAGTPAQVPALLGLLGRHDNPGLRESLKAALRTILGRGYAACVLSAAERVTDACERGLLLGALDGELSSRAVAALVRRDSPLVRPLLTALACGDLDLGSGETTELVAEFTAYDIAMAPAPASQEDAEVRADLITLDRQRPGYDARAVLRLAGRPGQPSAAQRKAMRAALPQLLAVAHDRPVDRAAVLRLVVDVCPAPWSRSERAVFADAHHVLTAELGAVEGVEKVLEAIAGSLSEVAAFVVAGRVRALPAQSFAGARPLAVLRNCGAVLTRVDVDRALVGAQAGPNPWEAEVALLRMVFASKAAAGSTSATSATATRSTDGPDAAAPSASPLDPAAAGRTAAALVAWQSALGDAVGSPGAFTAFRAEAGNPVDVDSRSRVAALIDAFPTADPHTRELLLDWLTELQPIDAPPWTLAEQAARTAAPTRLPEAADLDQPRSTAQRERLLALLTATERARRTAAARMLSGWDEPEVRRLVLDAHLRGMLDLPRQVQLARGLLWIADFDGYDEAGRERAARLCAMLRAEELERMAPHLISWWENGTPATRAQVFAATRGLSGDALAEALRTRLEEGRWGCLDLLLDRSMRRTPELTEVVRRLRVEGRGALADRLTLTDGLLLHADAIGRNGTALIALRMRSVPVGAEHPTRDELIAIARGDAPEQARRALSRLADEHGGSAEVRQLVVELLSHRDPRVRLHAHRISRRVLERAEYLRHTEKLLDDARRDVVRGAIRTLSRAGWEPAVPTLVTLFADADPVLREAAAEGLARIGVPALPTLRKAAAHARPDRRARYIELRDRIEAAPR